MIRRRLWLYRRILRNWYRCRMAPDGIEQQLEALTDPDLIERMAA